MYVFTVHVLHMHKNTCLYIHNSDKYMKSFIAKSKHMRFNIRHENKHTYSFIYNDICIIRHLLFCIIRWCPYFKNIMTLNAFWIKSYPHLNKHIQSSNPAFLSLLLHILILQSSIFSFFFHCWVFPYHVLNVYHSFRFPFTVFLHVITFNPTAARKKKSHSFFLLPFVLIL